MAPAPAPPRLRILSVGGNAVSAFLSWRLQATNACDVTLVWKSGYETVAQYGISIKSQSLGNERFKPYAVVRTPEEAAQSSKVPFDYVLLCVKALPDVYDLAQIIESVVTPQHTCILLNTTNSIGVEEYLEQRYSTNVVLSLVCGAELQQAGAAEFEHKGSSADMWVGWANKNANIPESIQKDMAEALAMTLSTANVSCLVSLNIRQQQLEKMIGPIAFHPASVLFNNPNLPQLYDLPGVAPMINGIINELIELAKAYGCELPEEFLDKTVAAMRAGGTSETTTSVMYQDFTMRRPMEVETFLGSPLRLAKECGVVLPRIEVIYALMHDKNQKNLKGELVTGPSNSMPPPRLSSMAGNAQRPPPMMNGMMKPRGNGSRAPSLTGPPRRGPYMNGYPPRMPNGSLNTLPVNAGVPYGHRNSVEGGELEEFSHVMLFENVPDGVNQDGSNGSSGEPSAGTGTPSSGELAIREREVQIRQREMELREREAHMHMRRGPPPQQRPPPRQRPPPGSVYDDEDDGDDYFDPMGGARPGMPIDENIDMLSITSRRHRKAPSAPGPMYSQPSGQRGSKPMFGPPGRPKNRSSARLTHDMPLPHSSLMDDPLMGYSSNRYGTVDRQAMQAESRAGSITNSRMDDLARNNGGSYPGGPGQGLGPRRASQQSQAFVMGPNAQRQSPPNGYGSGMRGPPRGPPPDGLGVRQPVPRHHPGQGSMVAPQSIEQTAGVSLNSYTKSSHQVRILTGVGSTSVKGIDNSKLAASTSSAENSASSSSSSLQPQVPVIHSVYS